MRSEGEEDCCRRVLEKELFQRGAGEECCREVLEKSVVEMCWRREVL